MPLPHILLALGVAVLWGFNFVVMKHAASELPPLGLTGARFLLAALPLLAFVPRPTVSAFGLYGFGLAFGVVKFGLLFTAFKLGMPSGLASIVLQMQVVFTVLFAILIFGERPLPMQWAGLAAALVGAFVIVLGMADGASLLPVCLTLAAAVAWGIGNIIIKREGRFEPLPFAVWSSVMPGIVMTAASLAVEGPTLLAASLGAMSWSGMAALAYLAWPVSIVSGAMWGFLMTRQPAAAIAPFILLVPVIGLASGWLVYGETQTALTWAGGSLIVVGLGLNILASRQAGRARAVSMRG